MFLKSIRNSPSSRKWILIPGLVVIVLLAGGWVGSRWIGGKVQASLVSQLNRRGLDLKWRHSSWDPWRGLHLTGLELRHAGSEAAPMMELGNLDLAFSYKKFLGGSGSTSVRIHNSAVTFRDEEGTVELEHVSLRMKATAGEIAVSSLEIAKGGTTADLQGKVILPSAPHESSEPFHLDLDALRATLSTLDVRADTGPFEVDGSFTIDATQPVIVWSASLKGEGSDLEWKGVRCSKASARGELSSSVSEVSYELFTSHGSTRGVASRKDWHDSPFIFQGTLRDSRGITDEYRGNYQNRVFTVQSLEGSADLWSLASDIPSIGDRRPDKVKFKTFPQIQLRNARRNAGAESPHWTIESLAIGSKDGAVFSAGGQDIEARALSAEGSFDGREWIIRDSSASMFGGSASLKGRYREGVLRQARINIDRVRMSELKQLSGKDGGKKSAGVLTARYSGSIVLAKKQLDGEGSLRLENAPVLEVPLLDQVYDLFSAMLPGVERPPEGEFNAEFRTRPDLVEVTRFEAKGGSSLTVSAVGTVDLNKGRVNGRARGKLVGLPGLVTSPLSRLLEMEVSGPYDDIRVRPLGPAKLASNTVSGTVGVAVDTLEETGKISGTIIKEGIKVPFGWLERVGKDNQPGNKPKR